MKTIVIAYDGSECAEAIFTELQRAGLPAQVKAHVVSVTDSWAVPLPSLSASSSITEGSAESSVPTEEAEALRGADAMAARGADRLRTLFPAWEVAAIGAGGSVARAILRLAADVSADMILIGSQSRSAVGRFFLGSVSQKVAGEARCSVRICRPHTPSGETLRLLVAVDGSRASEGAVLEVAERAWPAGTAVAAVNVIQPPRRPVADLPPAYAAEIERQHGARMEWLENVLSAAHQQLEQAGLAVERHSLDGEPKSTLLEWAERWKADCFFLGASGLHHADSTALGTVASALTVRAHCPVEIVRR